MKNEDSLNAMENKELNNEELIASEENVSKHDVSMDASNKGAGISASQFDDRPKATDGSVVRTKRNKMNIIIAISMVVLLLVGFVVTMLLVEEINKPDGNPIATIVLSDGKELEFELYEDTAPIAVANFMFLSMKGFFNDTVIHDIQNNWVRFMGLLEDYKTHRSEDIEYVKNFGGFDIYDYDWSVKESSNIFWYRLKKDTNSIKWADNQEEGLLCFQQANSSTMFQISCKNNPLTNINQTKYDTFTVLGKYRNDITLTYLRELDETTVTTNKPWENPDEPITIKNIKISNYDKTKWKGNRWTNKKGILTTFDTYIDQINGRNTHSTRYTNIY